MERVTVGLLGLGTVGAGVWQLLQGDRDRDWRCAGRPLQVKWVAVRDASRPRTVSVPPGVLTTDARRVVEDPKVDLVVETIGGTTAARDLVLAALAAGKDVVTANKALLAEHGPEVFAAARRHGRAIGFEASVGGGIPIIQAIQVGLAANRIEAISAIVNGTCNFILSAMSREGLSYEAALAQAQELGYAEPDPTLDVDGTDTAHKLAILSQLAFGTTVRLDQIPREGIDRLRSEDIAYASELGYAVKLLARGRQTEAGLELSVAPRLVRQGTPLADVQGPYNAIRVVGDAVGDTLFYGRGAGALPTASAIVGDIIDVVVGRAAITNRMLDLWSVDAPPARLASPNDIRTRSYLRFAAADRPGVIGAIAQVLGRHGISIASVIQHDPGESTTPQASVPLVIMTHPAAESALRAALSEIDRLEVVEPPSVCLGVEECD
jgi:homoserine dehydrogenase